MLPWMNQKDIRLIEKEILNLNKSHISVLEWGPGGSTVHFSKFMDKHNITYDWTAIEYNYGWYNEVKTLNISNVETVLFDVGNTKLKQRNTNMDKYVEYPLTLGKKFDFILVDGRKRRRCLINASNILKPNGVVLLHDAQRKYYHCAFESFARYKFLSKTLWVGYVKKLISVVMPVFGVRNHINLFKQALSGIINQTYSHWELIIACDSRNKLTTNCVKAEVKKHNDNRIRVMQSHNQYGPGIIRNMVYPYITGEYITFHDSDDFSMPNRFEKLMDNIDGYGIVASNLIVYKMYDGTQFSKRKKSFSGANLDMLINAQKVRAPICLATAIMSTKLFESMGGFEEYKYSSDSIFVIKLGYLREMTCISSIPVLSDALYVWNRHSLSITTKSRNAYVLRKCQKRQRKPLKKVFRNKILAKEINVGDPEYVIKEALGIKDNLTDVPARRIVVVDI